MAPSAAWRTLVLLLVLARTMCAHSAAASLGARGWDSPPSSVATGALSSRGPGLDGKLQVSLLPASSSSSSSTPSSPSLPLVPPVPVRSSHPLEPVATTGRPRVHPHPETAALLRSPHPGRQGSTEAHLTPLPQEGTWLPRPARGGGLQLHWLSALLVGPGVGRQAMPRRGLQVVMQPGLTANPVQESAGSGAATGGAGLVVAPGASAGTAGAPSSVSFDPATEGALVDIANAFSCILPLPSASLCPLEDSTISSLSLECGQGRVYVWCTSGGGTPQVNRLNFFEVTGSIPDSLSQLSTLTWLRINGTNITSSSLSGLALALPSLQYLWMGQTFASTNGSLADLSTLTALTGLVMGQAPVAGPIPDTLSLLSALQILLLQDIPLTGPLPASLGSLGSLTYLQLHRLSGIAGPFPGSLLQLPRLAFLSIEDVALSGPLPDGFGSLLELTYLRMQRVPLGGSLPGSLSQLSSLKALSFLDCKLTGSIPEALPGSLTGLNNFEFPSNFLVGSLPQSIQNLTALVRIDLSKNLLSGPLLPVTVVGDANGLGYSDASQNYFNNPDGGDSSSWELFNKAARSSNCLGLWSDRKPEECQAFCGTAVTTPPCEGLGTCVLTGDGAFQCTNCSNGTLTVGDTCSNSAPPPPLLPPPPLPPPGPGTNVAALAAGLSVGLTVLMLLTCALTCFRDKVFQLLGIRKPEEGSRAEGYRFAVEELSQATGNFSEENYLGHGGFGKVYYGRLPATHPRFPGQKVAVKQQLKTKSELADGEFFREAQILSTVRHRNVVELLGFCEGRGERFLVYEFVEKGSLFGVLNGQKSAPREGTPSGGILAEEADASVMNYSEGTGVLWEATGGTSQIIGRDGSTPNSGSAEPLRWDSRVRIAVGAARGLRYLHNELRQEILHLDIKSDNILVDAHCNAKVADFGISKMREATPDADDTDSPAGFPTAQLQSSMHDSDGASSSVTPSAVTEIPGMEEGISSQQSGAPVSLLTERLHGTYGYMDPAWFTTRCLTKKSDVYSFGTVLLELATGWSPFALRQSSSPVSLQQLVLQFVNLHGFMSVCAPAIAADMPQLPGPLPGDPWMGSYSQSQASATPDEAPGDAESSEAESVRAGNSRLDLALFGRFVSLGMWCCMYDREARPTMDQVFAVLQEIEEGKKRFRRDIGEGKVLGPGGLFKENILVPT